MRNLSKATNHNNNHFPFFEMFGKENGEENGFYLQWKRVWAIIFIVGFSLISHCIYFWKTIWNSCNFDYLLKSFALSIPSFGSFFQQTLNFIVFDSSLIVLFVSPQLFVQIINYCNFLFDFLITFQEHTCLKSRGFQPFLVIEFE